jgi:hypothetical protein
MQKLISDPLVHFLFIGACLFAVLAWFSDESDPQEIRVSAEAIRAAMLTRLPVQAGGASRADLDALVDSLIRDEVYYREALALGLDVDDDQVRTRLIEKMRYLSEDIADPEPADEAELRDFFDADPTRFALPESVSFDHVFFSPSQRGAEVRAQADSALALLRDGAQAATVGDSSPLGARFERAAAPRLNILFGETMTAAVFAAPVDEWSGPFESDFGLHLVRVTDHSPARQRTFAEARDAVLAAFASDRRERRNEAAWQAMRSRYEVIVDWPEELGAAN